MTYSPNDKYETILNYLRLNDDSLEAQQISDLLAISLPTTYKLIDTMCQENCLTKDKTRISINKEYYTIVGISIGTSLCKVSFLDFSFNRFSSDRFSTYKKLLYDNISSIIPDDILLEKSKNSDIQYLYFTTPDNFNTLKDILNSIFGYIQTATKNNFLHIISIGISCTGMINNRTQIIMECNNLKYIENCGINTLIFPDKKAFFAEHDIYVSLLQNCDASVIAEKVGLCHTRSELSAHNVITLYLEYGLGAGLYFDQLYSGANGYSGEIGHLPAPYHKLEDTLKENLNINVAPNETCSCGNPNCFDFKIRKYCFYNIKDFTKKEFKDCSASDISAFLESNPDNAALLGEYLGDIINTLTGLLDIDAIIFTGKIYKSMDKLLTPISRIQDQSKLRHSRNDCNIITSEIGSSAPSIGAALYSYKQKYNLPYKWEPE